jgi:hypothetical protein
MTFTFLPLRKKVLITVLAVFIGALCFSQNTTTKSDFWQKVNFYGGIGFNFTNGGFNGSISPGAVYRFNEYVSAGLGANVNFFKFDNEKFWAYGPSAIVLANPIKQIQISGEYETLRINSSIQTGNQTFRNDFWSDALFLGVGYRTQYAVMGIRYNVLYDNESIYLNAWTPFVRLMF